jgi:hypothetical protein
MKKKCYLKGDIVYLTATTNNSTAYTLTTATIASLLGKINQRQGFRCKGCGKGLSDS